MRLATRHVAEAGGASSSGGDNRQRELHAGCPLQYSNGSNFRSGRSIRDRNQQMYALIRHIPRRMSSSPRDEKKGCEKKTPKPESLEG